ncbi:MAG: hypothetical protein JW866_01685, partial [Ignavibacteriales bacterium]|nr:hypothetical protein [Ignavibacteriales bacterium]
QSKKNIRILPGKTFEYLRMNKPILVLGPEEGETARIIKEVDYGKVLEYEKYDEIYKFIKEKFLEWKSGKVVILQDPNRIKKFERKNLTKELANLFDQLTG